jgi:hypothetical protein
MCTIRYMIYNLLHQRDHDQVTHALEGSIKVLWKDCIFCKHPCFASFGRVEPQYR